MRGLLGVVVVVWLVSGLLAAFQRVNPKVDCSVPQPSR